MELDLEAMLIGEALILNRSLDQLYGYYIELNDLNEPLELRGNRVHDFKHTIEEEQKTNVRVKTDDNPISKSSEWLLRKEKKGSASVSVMPLLTYLNLGLAELAYTKLIVELAYMTVKYPKRIAENILVDIGKFVFPIDFIILDMLEDVKVPLIFERSFLSTTHTKIDVFKRKITLRVGDEKIIFKSVKPSSSLINRVYMLSLRERIELDLEARLMGETLVLNRSLDPLYGDYIKLNDLNVPLELRRDQVDDLIPTIEEGQVIDKTMIDIIKTKINESFDEYPSFCDFDQKTHIDCAYNLRFSCMIVENIDGYRDQDMGDIILRESLCKASCVEARRFDGLITIHNGIDNVTYQMARSHPRFKHLSNAQCNKIKPLLKVPQYGVFQFMDTAYWSSDLATKKSMKLVKYRSFGILCEPTMEEYMTRTQEGNGSGNAKRNIKDKDHFELKGQFLKELRDNTFSGSDNEDANKPIEKFIEIVDLFHIPNITQDQVMLRAFSMSLTGAASHWLRNEPAGIPYMKAAEAKKSIKEMADHSKKWHNGMST
nr:hypothetical protein [Tanacetum cinerariifolium]